MKLLVSNTEYGNERGEIDMQQSEVVRAESDVTSILAIEFGRAVKDSYRNSFWYYHCYCYCCYYYYYY